MKVSSICLAGELFITTRAGTFKIIGSEGCLEDQLIQFDRLSTVLYVIGRKRQFAQALSQLGVRPIKQPSEKFELQLRVFLGRRQLARASWSSAHKTVRVALTPIAFLKRAALPTLS